MYEELLGRVALFQELSRHELTLLGDACREREYVPGQTLACQGSAMVGLMLIIEGAVEVVHRGDDGAVDATDQLGAGAILGESVLLKDTPSAETITASQPTRALALPIWDFRLTLRDFPDLAIHLLAILSQRLRPPA